MLPKPLAFAQTPWIESLHNSYRGKDDSSSIFPMSAEVGDVTSRFLCGVPCSILRDLEAVSEVHLAKFNPARRESFNIHNSSTVVADVSFIEP